jgi:hypothetical protein
VLTEENKEDEEIIKNQRRWNHCPQQARLSVVAQNAKTYARLGGRKLNEAVQGCV